MFDDFYESFLALGNAYSDAVSNLNNQSLNYFNSSEMVELKKQLALLAKSTDSKNQIKKKLSDIMMSIKQNYNQSLDAGGFSRIINDEIKDIFVDIQLDTMFQLSQSIQTQMIRDLTFCFVSGKYNGINDVINKTMSKQIIPVADVSFIKTSELIQNIGHRIKYPRGFSSSIKALNISTANDISKNLKLEYDTETNLFLSENGTVNSSGLNVICSGKDIFLDVVDEFVSENELIDFLTYLSRTPMLAGTTDTGKKILEYIERLYNDKSKTINFDSEFFYHCRARKKDEIPYTYNQMLKAPVGISGSGRFNHPGEPNYYFANTKKGAEVEVKKHLSNDDELQTVKLKPVKDIKLLDLSSTLNRGKTFLKYLRYDVSNMNEKMPNEYRIPCYVSDCCKKVGFEGIKYYGSKEYFNYVAWNDGYFEYVEMI